MFSKQNCDGYGEDVNGNQICNLVLSGGGGGCCDEKEYEYDRAGFYVLGFDDNANLVQLYDIFDDQISFNNSGYDYTDIEINDVKDIDVDSYTCPTQSPTTSPTAIPTNDSDNASTFMLQTSTLITFVFIAFVFVFF